MAIGKISNQKDLHIAISQLEKQIAGKEMNIETTVNDIKEGLKPNHLLRNTFSYLAQTPELKKIIINTAIGFTIGYLTKKTATAINEFSINRLAENFVHHHIDRLENKNPDSWLSKGIQLVRKYTPPSSPIYGFVKY